MSENQLTGSAEFDHDGETLTLKLSIDALLEAEAESGFGVVTMMPEKLDHLGVLIALLRAGLRHGCDRQLDRAAAGQMLLGNPAAAAAILRASGYALPRAKKGTAARPRRAAKNGAGTIS